MSDIEVYTFEDADGTPDGYSTMSAKDATNRARNYRLRAVANVYEWTEAVTLVDYTRKDKFT